MLNGEEATWSPVPAVNTTLNGNLLGTIRVSYWVFQVSYKIHFRFWCMCTDEGVCAYLPFRHLACECAHN